MRLGIVETPVFRYACAVIERRCFLFVLAKPATAGHSEHTVAFQLCLALEAACRRCHILRLVGELCKQAF